MLNIGQTLIECIAIYEVKSLGITQYDAIFF